MVATCELLASGKNVLQMAAPQCRVFAISPSPRLGVVQHPFDAPAQPRSGFGLGLPDWRKHFQNVISRNIGNRLGAKRDAYRSSVMRHCARCFVVAPLPFHRSKEQIGAIAKSRNRVLFPFINRVAPLGNCLTALSRQSSRLGELYGRVGPNPISLRLPFCFQMKAQDFAPDGFTLR
jgi:hypothetical protein